MIRTKSAGTANTILQQELMDIVTIVLHYVTGNDSIGFGSFLSLSLS